MSSFLLIDDVSPYNAKSLLMFAYDIQTRFIVFDVSGRKFIYLFLLIF